MDGLFSGSAGDRRRFLDRLVLALDARHGSRVSAYERALRSRNRLLEEPAPDRAWLDGIEAEAAALGTAIARIRLETVRRLGAIIEEGRGEESPFPHAVLALDGDMDRWLAEDPSLAEPRFRTALRDGRPRDAAARRALIGPQASDFLVRHGPKDVAAERASTGEQKALLVGLVLAHARLVARESGLAPIVLLDEIAAHLDVRRRAALYAALERLGSQVFMTGADPGLFAELPQSAAIFRVGGGKVELITVRGE
jgi:DNA replication and repair protein RecF